MLTTLKPYLLYFSLSWRGHADAWADCRSFASRVMLWTPASALEMGQFALACAATSWNASLVMPSHLHSHSIFISVTVGPSPRSTLTSVLIRVACIFLCTRNFFIPISMVHRKKNKSSGYKLFVSRPLYR